jgi:hypothetical protein
MLLLMLLLLVACLVITLLLTLTFEPRLHLPLLGEDRLPERGFLAWLMSMQRPLNVRHWTYRLRDGRRL